jgi:hypothetical protein
MTGAHMRRIDDDKIVKTVELLICVNAGLAGLVMVDPNIYLLIALAVNALILHHLHELGRRRRPGSNLLNGLNSIFASRGEADSREIDNMLRNIVNGGAAIHDEITDGITEAIGSLRR